MPNENEIKKTSAMAGRLEEVLENCKKIEDKDIPVPLDVRGRMKALCSETEKILKDIPNKKFSVAVHMHAGEKAEKYLGKIYEGMAKVYYNYFAFSALLNFYGMSGGNAKSDIKKYYDKMQKYDEEFGDIDKKVVKFLENNPTLSKNNRPSAFDVKLNKDDEKLIYMGCICDEKEKANVKPKNYFNYVKKFFEKFVNHGINVDDANGKSDLIGKFTEVSDTLRNLKEVVAKNEEAALKGNIQTNGIQTTRNNAYNLMGKISIDLKDYLKAANHCVEFLNSLYIKSPELSDERDESVNKIETAIKEYNKKLVGVREFRSSIKYGETTFNIGGGQKKLAMGKNRVVNTFFDAAGVRDSCNDFIKDLNYILSGIKSGQKIATICSRTKLLNKTFDKFVESVNKFVTGAKAFKGYYNVDKIDPEDIETLENVHMKYKDIYDELTRININNINAQKQIKDLEKMEKKVKREVEKYNKVSSKIKRGVKKVFGVMGTIARYTLNVTEFLKNVLFISSNCPVLAQSLEKNDQAAAQVQYVPVPVTVNSN